MPPSSTVPAVYRLTYEDWLRLPDDGRLYEIVGGELFVSPAPTTRHQRVVRNLQLLVEAWLRQTDRGESLSAPTAVRLSPEDVLEPDLLVILAEHAGRIEEACVVGPPDLVVEVLSPGTAGRDLLAKRDRYEASGVPEYWIVDLVQREIEVLVLDSGRYRRAGRFSGAETLASPSPAFQGLALPLAEIFPR